MESAATTVFIIFMRIFFYLKMIRIQTKSEYHNILRRAELIKLQLIL